MGVFHVLKIAQMVPNRARITYVIFQLFCHGTFGFVGTH